MRILGIESSCDDTGVALFCTKNGLIENKLYSQVSTHAEFGGVVPELASRDHVRKIIPLLQATLEPHGGLESINGVAYTSGPGLMGSLMVGSLVGRSLAYSLNVPALGVNHLEGHILAVMLEESAPTFPFLTLLVSGGHTLLIHAKDFGDYEIIGESIDDAAGEAFDKTAKLLGLPYPGGPHLAKLAQNGKNGRFKFPRPMTDRPGLDFSFSGLKTFTRNTIETQSSDEQTKADIALAFEEAVVDTLIIKCRRALEQTGMKSIVVAGGVGANRRLRENLGEFCAQNKISLFFPQPKFCTDNGAMIAVAGAIRLEKGQQDDLVIKLKPRWPLSLLS